MSWSISFTINQLNLYFHHRSKWRINYLSIWVLSYTIKQVDQSLPRYWGIYSCLDYEFNWVHSIWIFHLNITLQKIIILVGLFPKSITTRRSLKVSICPRIRVIGCWSLTCVFSIEVLTTIYSDILFGVLKLIIWE